MAKFKPVLQLGGQDVSKELLLDLTAIYSPFGGVKSRKPRNNENTPATPLFHNWTRHLYEEYPHDGYGASLISTEIGGRTHYFILHEGSNAANDIPSIGSLANSRVPAQYLSARDFTRKAEARILEVSGEKNPPVMHVGYSLGGALAMLVSDKGEPIISFDAPGTRKLLESKGYDTQDLAKRTLDVLSPHPNIVNAHGEHIGNILIAGEKYWETDQVSIEDFIRMTLETHSAGALHSGLKTMTEFKPVPAQESDRVKDVFAGFREYLYDHISPQPKSHEKALLNTAALVDRLSIDILLTRMIAMSMDHVAAAFTPFFSKEAEMPLAQLALEQETPTEANPHVLHPHVTNNLPKTLRTERAESQQTAQSGKENSFIKRELLRRAQGADPEPPTEKVEAGGFANRIKARQQFPQGATLGQ